MNDYQNKSHNDTVKKTTFFLSMLITITIFVITLIGIIFYYEKRIENIYLKDSNIPLPTIKEENGNENLLENILVQ